MMHVKEYIPIQKYKGKGFVTYVSKADLDDVMYRCISQAIDDKPNAFRDGFFGVISEVGNLMVCLGRTDVSGVDTTELCVYHFEEVLMHISATYNIVSTEVVYYTQHNAEEIKGYWDNILKLEFLRITNINNWFEY